MAHRCSYCRAVLAVLGVLAPEGPGDGGLVPGEQCSAGPLVVRAAAAVMDQFWAPLAVT